MPNHHPPQSTPARLTLVALGVSIALTAALLILATRTPPKSWPISHPVALRAIFHETEVIQGEGSMVARQGTMTYIVKNKLPIPVKLAFPPVGFVSAGSVPTTPYVSDVQQMPSFCRNHDIIVIEPQGERQFSPPESTLVTHDGNGRWSVQFVFGPPADSQEEGVVVDAVEAVVEIEKATKR